MSLQLDHFFLLTEPSSPEGDQLLEIGLVEGPSNVHPGQGTANRRFFCANTTIELLHVRDPDEARKGAGQRLRIAERTGGDASPIGLVVRFDADSERVPYAHWQYQPDYFPTGMCFLVGENSDDLQEPLCICMPPALALPSSPPEPCNRHWKMTRLRVHIPGETMSPVLGRFAQCEGVEIVTAASHLLEVEFNQHERSRSRRFAPELPLVISW